MSDTRKKLENLVEDFVGYSIEHINSITDTALIAIILIELAKKAEKQEDHTHNIN
jgi:hypothetical protein